MNKSQFLISGLGMISSIGPDVATSCAALRAGLVRPREIPYFSLLASESQRATPVIGRPIHGYTEGLGTVALWIRLGLACLQDLIGFGRLPCNSDGTFWSMTGLIAATPSLDSSRFDSDEPITSEIIRADYLEPLIGLLDYPIRQRNVDSICIGHVGAISAVKRAQTMITRQQVERVIVLAVDSYLDPSTLEWLDEHNRLKTADNPVGIIPGEAGACFMIESRASSTKRSATICAALGDPALGEEAHFPSDDPITGVGLSTTLSEALLRAAVRRLFEGDVISDCNGEPWRARELGSARVRLSDKLGSRANFIFPCASLGEIGAASGTVAVCAAARSLQRGYATGEAVVIISRSEQGEVGAIGVMNG
jgi:3-oxoacyl-[acyl-carrier-protein] synthase I